MAAGYGPGKTGGTGLVLVFDLDQTLIDTKAISKITRTDDVIKAALNRKIVNGILGPATAFRTSYPGSIDAILLLTNNRNAAYISKVCEIISQELGHTGSNFRNIQSIENSRFKNKVPLFFDYIMMHQNMKRYSDNKSLRDVRIMLNILKVKDDNLASRTYFFDDQEHGIMRSEIGDSHYIKITGPDVDPDHPLFNFGFRQGKEDLTNYQGIDEELRRISSQNSSAAGVPDFSNNDVAAGVPDFSNNDATASNASNVSNSNGASAKRLPGNNTSVVGGRRRKSITLKRKYKKRKTIRRRTAKYRI